MAVSPITLNQLIKKACYDEDQAALEFLLKLLLANAGYPESQLDKSLGALINGQIT